MDQIDGRALDEEKIDGRKLTGARRGRGGWVGRRRNPIDQKLMGKQEIDGRASELEKIDRLKLTGAQTTLRTMTINDLAELFE